MRLRTLACVGGLAAHVQMAINEQTKKSKVLFISVSQSDEISAKPDTSPLTFHEALNPTITSRAVGTWVAQNLGKKWWIQAPANLHQQNGLVELMSRSGCYSVSIGFQTVSNLNTQSERILQNQVEDYQAVVKLMSPQTPSE